jgi:hypothetical protein
MIRLIEEGPGAVELDSVAARLARQARRSGGVQSIPRVTVAPVEENGMPDLAQGESNAGAAHIRQ